MSSSATARRKPAPRLARPAARYRRGQVPKGVDALPSDSDEYEEEDQQQVGEEEGDVPIEDLEDDDEDGLDVAQAPVKEKLPARGMNVSLKDVNISKEGKVIVAGREEVGRTQAEIEEEEEEESEEEEDAASDGEESSEDESSSEEEDPPKPQFRPVFVPKRARATVAEKEALAQDTEEALERKEKEAEERRLESHNLVAETIKRELLEKEKEEEVPDIDDTDGVDPTAEFEAWRLRELARIKRDKEDAMRRELEREEVERRRALPEEQRLREDMEHAEKLRQEKPKGQQKFLQKYWHKGAFHQDAEILKRHDFTEATESTVDVSLLPKVMQVKNFGKRGRTKYTHLLDQDTTASSGGFGGSAPVSSGGTNTAGGGCFLCGGPHLKKDCPQFKDLPPGRPGTGANSSSMSGGSRTWGSGGAQRRDQDNGTSSSWRDRDSNRDRKRFDDRRDSRGDDEDYRRDRGDRGWERDRAGERNKYDGRDRRRSRSRSPRRDQRRDDYDGRRERRRSRSRSMDDGREEKRRRVAV